VTTAIARWIAFLADTSAGSPNMRGFANGMFAATGWDGTTSSGRLPRNSPATAWLDDQAQRRKLECY
jgi:hypothetical protein